MDIVANTPASDRAELFRSTGAQMGLESALIEKDFWVCWILAHLFEIESVRDALMFKGGTALSKVFKLIDRFSEDIDLAIDYAPLGFVNDRDPRMEMSRTRRGHDTTSPFPVASRSCPPIRALPSYSATTKRCR